MPNKLMFCYSIIGKNYLNSIISPDHLPYNPFHSSANLSSNKTQCSFSVDEHQKIPLIKHFLSMLLKRQFHEKDPFTLELEKKDPVIIYETRRMLE